MATGVLVQVFHAGPTVQLIMDEPTGRELLNTFRDLKLKPGGNLPSIFVGSGSVIDLRAACAVTLDEYKPSPSDVIAESTRRMTELAERQAREQQRGEEWKRPPVDDDDNE